VKLVAKGSLVIALLFMSACGSTQRTSSASVTASPTAVPLISTSPSATGLFAVLRARGPGSSPDAHDFIVIAGPDGYGRARATFTPRHIPVPAQCCGGLLTEPEAHVAGGAVYFIDGTGVVRRLTQAGSISVVATFSLSPNQLISFAVSPDGRKVMAAMLTIPTGNEPLTLDLWLVTDNRPATRLHHAVAKQSYDLLNIQLVDWDAEGPIAVVGGPFAAEHGLLDGQRWFGGHLARLDLSGVVGQTLGGSDCVPYALPLEGRVICSQSLEQGGFHISVRSLAGQVIWNGPPAITVDQGYLAISPDGSRLAMHGAIQSFHGTKVPLPAQFLPTAWLDSKTLIGILAASHTSQEMGIVRVDAPGTVQDWGFAGEFVGNLWE
jgi:hypothetical protein